MTTAAEVAAAIVTMLNGGTYTLPATAARAYAPVIAIKAITDPIIRVVPAAISIDWASRTHIQYRLRVDIGVHKQIDQTDQADIDGAAQLAHEVLDRLLDNAITVSGEKVSLVAIEHDPIYATEHIRKQLFTSLITATYEWRRQIGT